MKRLALLAALVVTTAVAVSVIASEEGKKKAKAEKAAAASEQPKDKDKEEDRWMNAKLGSAQAIFAGLTHGDLDVVKKRAQTMLVINVLENWVKKNDFTQKSAYQGQLNAFEFANKELIRQAEDDNLDGALDAWVKLSRSCVECHKLIRDPAK